MTHPDVVTVRRDCANRIAALALNMANRVCGRRISGASRACRRNCGATATTNRRRAGGGSSFCLSRTARWTARWEAS